MRVQSWCPIVAMCVSVLSLSMILAGHGQALESTAPVANKPDQQTWFVRMDGGDRKQCTGKVDAAYPGRGSKQPCAFKHPYYLFTNDEYGDKRWIISGGDTILLRGGPYRIGYKGPGPKDYWGTCPGDAFGCGIPPMPSGTQEHPTRLLGEDHGACKKKTQLFGGYEVYGVLSLQGSKYVDVECIEITDHSECIRVPVASGTNGVCTRNEVLGDYADIGILTDQGTANLVLKDIDIHGMTLSGIQGPIGQEVVADRLRVAFNGGAGWNFDDGRGTKNPSDSSVRASFLTVEWNGCNEEYPIRHAIPAASCFDQNSGGYGDGIGTADTPLNFTCVHCLFRYNTQDGFDLLHTSGSIISIKQSAAYGNMGQQWKLGPMQSVVFQNNETVNNCRRMSAPMNGAPDGYHRNLSLFCRASGEGITFAVADGGTYVFQNNSFAGYGATSYAMSCKGGCNAAKIIFQNNLNIGYKDQDTGKQAAIFYTEGVPAHTFSARDHNIYFNMRGLCPSGTTESCSNPKIANLPAWNGEASLDTIDFHLTSGSPAKGAGVSISGITNDYDGAARAAGLAYDIGAFQFHP